MKRHYSIRKKGMRKRKKLRRKRVIVTNRFLFFFFAPFFSFFLSFSMIAGRCKKNQTKHFRTCILIIIKFCNFFSNTSISFLLWLRIYMTSKQVTHIYYKIVVKKSVNDWCLLLNVQHQANKIFFFDIALILILLLRYHPSHFFFHRTTPVAGVT
jgi:hypothetical protein